ncbi:MAG: hypothetical protein H6Q38_465, partial [Chloroflexi bacterium]|nr:hypothetical protein [Chloroflexota bacterium]
SCQAVSEVVQLNAEFDEYRWVRSDELVRYDLNVETVKTFAHLGLIT